MQAPPSWSIHFHFVVAPKDHYANMYGFKSEGAMKQVLFLLENSADVDKLYWTKQWKLTKMSRWQREEYHIR